MEPVKSPNFKMVDDENAIDPVAVYKTFGYWWRTTGIKFTGYAPQAAEEAWGAAMNMAELMKSVGENAIDDETGKIDYNKQCNHALGYDTFGIVYRDDDQEIKENLEYRFIFCPECGMKIV